MSMELLKLGLQVVTYFVIGIVVSKITLGVQSQIRDRNGEEQLDEDTKLGIAGLIMPLWPVLFAVLVVYICLALIMNVFSRLMKPFV